MILSYYVYGVKGDTASRTFVIACHMLEQSLDNYKMPMIFCNMFLLLRDERGLLSHGSQGAEETETSTSQLIGGKL